MTDYRVIPDPTVVSMTAPGQIAVPLTDLRRAPDGPRDRQALYGDAVTILAQLGAWSYVQLRKDDYCGYVITSALGAEQVPTHRVTAPATHAYQQPDMKTPDLASLSFASHVTVTSDRRGFAQTPLGHIPLQHLSPNDYVSGDPAMVAELFLGTPYLWGGNSRWGIDCSGLVQAAFLACGIPCPGDSDQQQQSLGDFLAAGTPFERNDLLFWKGHVALVTAVDLMIHANAHKMAVTLEPISQAIPRIAGSDGSCRATDMR